MLSSIKHTPRQPTRLCGHWKRGRGSGAAIACVRLPGAFFAFFASASIAPLSAVTDMNHAERYLRYNAPTACLVCNMHGDAAWPY